MYGENVLVLWSSGVNFTNILGAAFTLKFITPKNNKPKLKVQKQGVILLHEKSEHENLLKLTPAT